MDRRPKLLDLYCGAGGCSAGYTRAGFDVTGVDRVTQPHYPYEFIQGDALEVLADAAFLAGFHAIHASPPCKGHGRLAHLADEAHQNLIPATRAGLRAWGGPWVMENVPGAPVEQHVVLCGSMFGLGADSRVLKRHRLFEASGLGLVLTPPHTCTTRPICGVYGHGGRERPGAGYALNADAAREAMGIGWMTRDELSQAIPPSYTTFLGEHLLSAVTTGLDAARCAATVASAAPGTRPT